MSVDKLGYFLTKSGERQEAENVFVLTVCYSLVSREDTDIAFKTDKKKLRLTFESKRNCKYVEMNSPPIEDLLQLLADKTRLMAQFNSEGKAPDVFLLLIMAHGGYDGQLATDEENSFNIEYVFDSLANLDCLKIVFIESCRPSFVPENTEKDFRNACRITNTPSIHDLVVFYSTVDCTSACCLQERGSIFIQIICNVLNKLHCDEALISVLTHVKNVVWNFKIPKTLNTLDEDIPEVKFFSLTRNFIISGLTEMQIPSLGRYEGLYPWKSDKGQRWSRRAIILHRKSFNDLQEIADGLERNLGFECDSVDMHGIDHCDQLNRVLGKPAERVGCIMLVLYGPLEEDPDTKEVFVNWTQKFAVTDVLLRLMRPEFEGIPKIIFVINQNEHKKNEVNKARQLRLGATDFSGWLVLVLQNQESVNGLARILNGDGIKTGCLQDELVKLLVDDKRSPNFLNSTLHYKLRFPTSFFVEPDFEI